MLKTTRKKSKIAKLNLFQKASLISFVIIVFLLAGFSILWASLPYNRAKAELSVRVPSHEAVTKPVYNVEKAIEKLAAAPKIPSRRSKYDSPDLIQRIFRPVIGTREFIVTAEGNFKHFACKAIKEAIYTLPVDTDIIVTARRDKPFEVLRLDLLKQSLKKQNLPFIIWEDVPVEDRPKAHFSTISTLKWGRAGKDSVITPLVRDRRVMEMIDFERTIALYPEFVMSSKRTPVRRYKLTDAHSLVEVQGYYGLAHYDETLFQNWDKGYSPFVGGASIILGPFITLRHPPENIEAEASIASNLLNQENTLLEIFRDNQFLYTVTIQDKIQWSKLASIKVTRFDPSQFAHVVIEGESVALSNNKLSTSPQGDSVKLCELTLQPKESVIK